MALAGGGPLGGIYEIGALAALADCLDGIDFNALDLYVGVSSGGFVAAGLANGLTPRQMCRMFIESDTAEEPFDPAVLLRPAYGEFASRLAQLPSLAATAAVRAVLRQDGSTIAALKRLGRALPTGLFDGAQIDRALAALFSRRGRTNDFRKLRRALYIVATELDSGAVVKFGSPGYDHVPISTAVRASASLPGLFPPAEIDGRHYADGALQKTLHASVALEHGVRLVLCINPLVPFNAARTRDTDATPRSVVAGGLPAVLSQTFRTILRSRLEKGFASYATEYPGRDLVLLEPDRYDAELFFRNIFSYASRRRLAEHAYARTRADLRARQATLAPILARHGITIRATALADPHARLVSSAPRREAPRRLRETVSALERAVTLLDTWVKTGANRTSPKSAV